MTSLQLTILILSTVAGGVANAKQSGELPKPWVPWATVVGAFAVSAGASLGQVAASGGTMTVAVAIAAIAAGVQAVIAAMAGVGLHIHFRMHKIASKAPANDNGTNAVQEPAKPAA